MNKIKYLSIILIILGMILLLYSPISNYINQKNQNEIIKDYGQKIESTQSRLIEEELKKAIKYNQNLFEENENDVPYLELLNINKDGVMGYIEIPKINLKLVIYHGTNEETLKKGVGHLEKSSLPIGGKSSYTVLTGHSGLKQAKIFTRIEELKNGDRFYINVLGLKLEYKVFSIEKVLPTEIEGLKIQEDEDLAALVTCTPIGINTHRLIVKGKRV